MKWAVPLLAVLAGDVLTPAVPRDFFRSGALTPVASSGAAPAEPPSAIAIDALPYTRTLVCGSYTLTGTSAGADSVAWSASPSGASGSCSGTDTWSCAVSVSPDATGEGVETITVTATSGGGTLTDTETLGFFPGTAYSCHLAQNINGTYNSGLSSGAAIATWEDSGTGNLDLTQGTAGSRPSYQPLLLGTMGQPLVRCDGNDSVAGATAADWTFLGNGDARTVLVGQATQALNPAANMTLAGNKTNTDAGRGWRLLSMDSGINDSARQQVGDNAAGILVTNLAADTVISQRLNSIIDIVDDDGGAGADGFLYANDTSTATAAATGAFSATVGSALTLCDRAGAGGNQYTGTLSHFVTYARALTSGERDVVDDVVEWAYGQATPASLPIRPLRADIGITLSGSSVTTWAFQGIEPTVSNLTTCSVGTTCPLISGSGVTLGVDFDGVNDTLTGGETLFTNSSGHVIVVATIDGVDSNQTGANCWNNDTVLGGGTNWGLRARTSGGSYFIMAHNFDGSHDCAETTFTLNNRIVIEWRHSGGNIGVAVNGGTFVEAASGNTSSLASWGLGVSGSPFIGMVVHEVQVFSHALPTSNRTSVVNNLISHWSITP